MAKEGPGGERTEKATSHKRQEERKKGHVMKSMDVVTAAFIVITFMILRFTVRLMLTESQSLLTEWIGYAGSGFEEDGTIGGYQPFIKLFMDLIRVTTISAGITMVTTIIISFIMTGVQTGFLVSTEQMKPKFDKLNPIKGMAKFFNANAFFEQFKSLIKMTILVIISFMEIRERLPEFISLYDSDIRTALVVLGDTIFTIAMKIAVAFVVIAAIDFFWQRYRFEEDMKMSKQEVKEEYKNMEGDPQIRSRRRSIQQKMSMQRMMQAIPEADVIIRNPTHFAIAVKYDEKNNSAPKVIAKGKDRVALRIIDIATEAGVMLIENKPLARVLYEKVDIDREIPSELYQAVAEVLAFVFKLKKGEPAVYAPKAVVEM
ncbi:MAG: flagellar biosynthesis protein FlhB [Ruminococcus sp.]|jgi:flagellar biosynthetic protein FlhB|nr:flagellar biosynthesis protein FlhB [Ruminococcus sp.]